MKLMDRVAQWLKMAAETDEKALDPAVRTALRCCAYQIEADVREQAEAWTKQSGGFRDSEGAMYQHCARDLLATTDNDSSKKGENT